MRLVHALSALAALAAGASASTPEASVSSETVNAAYAKAKAAEEASLEAKRKAEAEAVRASKAAEAARETHWDYCLTGPDNWAALDTAYAACSDGLSQSPIDVVESEVQANEKLRPLGFDYNESKATLVNTGKLLQVNYDSGSMVTTENNKQFELLQVTFHTPSEHLINGKPAAMEVHLVHKSSSQDKVVVAVLVEEGAENTELGKFLSTFPEHTGTATGEQNFNAKGLLPMSQQYYTYEGSFTTPPCTEGVQYFVMKSPITFSTAQLDEFKARVPFNARRVRKAHGRSVAGTTWNEDSSGAPVGLNDEPKVQSAEWSYCPSGPSNWSNLSGFFDLCADGEHQSPINVVRGNVERTSQDVSLQFNYRQADLVLQNDGPSIQINSDGKSNLKVNGEEYSLLQANFHTPSEHLIDNEPAPMEMHLVHKNQATNKMLILVVLMQEGDAPNAALAQFWDSLPRSKIVVDLHKKFDINSLVPASAASHYFHYSGSLTAPPCTENIEYYIAQEGIFVSADQIAAFQSILPSNARPTNGLYGRKVTMTEAGFFQPSGEAQKTQTLADAAAESTSKSEDPTAGAAN